VNRSTKKKKKKKKKNRKDRHQREALQTWRKRGATEVLTKRVAPQKGRSMAPQNNYYPASCPSYHQNKRLIDNPKKKTSSAHPSAHLVT
jgi:hypothetical protein